MKGRIKSIKQDKNNAQISVEVEVLDDSDKVLATTTRTIISTKTNVGEAEQYIRQSVKNIVNQYSSENASALRGEAVKLVGIKIPA